jgi:lipase
MRLRLLNVAVDGGDLRVLLWGTGNRVAVAVHGITASGMSWQAVARHMPPDWTLAAPDLRGRGYSSGLPGPYGLDRHARDVAAVLRHFGGRPVLAGHSMGAYVALLTRDAHPELVRRLVLVDGGLPLSLPEGIDPDALLDATLGPAIARLRQTYPDTEAYLDFWRAHPALAEHWTADVEAYARYDLSRPTPLLTAPAGMFGAPPGLLPPEVVAAWQERVPALRPQTVPGVNHYTILFEREAAAAVSQAIRAAAL